MTITPTRMNSKVIKYILLWCAVILVMIVLLFLITKSRGRKYENKNDVKKNPVTKASQNIQYNRTPLIKNIPIGSSDGLDGIVSAPQQIHKDSKSVKKLLELYKKSKRYGYNTFKLTEDMVDVLNPNRFHPVTAPFTTKEESENGQFNDDPEERIFFRFETDRFSFIEDEKLEVRLAIYKGEKTKKPVKAALSDVVVFKNNKTGTFEKISTLSLGEYSPRFPGDGQYVGNFQPSIFIKDEFDGYLKFLVKWQIEGENPTNTELLVHYTKFSPAVFNGKIRDEVIDGSLKITVGLNVEKTGKYILTALLYDSSGKITVAYSNISVQLTSGETEATFPFYGMLFRDLGVAGPYKLKRLSGYLSGASTYGKGALLRDWNGNYSTQPYKIEEFSDEAYSDPDMQGTISAYEKQIRELEAKENQ
ncbi:hypothetical protein KKF34_19715 [Myxococcota bacterium]|nr:hypothetical protein [Myxococcota bacterium]MBU1381367.1 hypothetical protein [Myxococcota bacterium]MBU1499118.1 hypothetical protein [Myxococcota bacterium]